MKNIFYFGEKVDGFNIRVLNEREIRAGAGLLFVGALISFMNVWLIGNFKLMQLFILFFIFDFFVRLFINPKYAPSLIIAKLVVNNQKVEYVGAPQKKFAWAIGFILALIIFYNVILNQIFNPLNILICLLCLIFLFFETSFGICLGCKIYNLFNKEKAKLCPGGVCEVHKKEKIQKVNLVQIMVVFFLVILIYFGNNLINLTRVKQEQKMNNINVVDDNFIQKSSLDDCIVPDWAKKIGHEEQYKLHHGCDK